MWVFCVAFVLHFIIICSYTNGCRSRAQFSSLFSEERIHFECMFEDKGILNKDLFWVNSLSLHDDNSLSLHDEIYFFFRL